MKNRLRFATPIALMVLSASSLAAGRLTPQECNSYPFAVVAGKVTHEDLLRELIELESVGYRPATNDPMYPKGIMQAEKLLHAKYLADCKPDAQAAPPTNGTPSSND